MKLNPRALVSLWRFQFSLCHKQLHDVNNSIETRNGLISAATVQHLLQWNQPIGDKILSSCFSNDPAVFLLRNHLWILLKLSVCYSNTMPHRWERYEIVSYGVLWISSSTYWIFYTGYCSPAAPFILSDTESI
jgi:hypothetical protein